MKSPAPSRPKTTAGTLTATSWRSPLVLFAVLFMLFGLTARHGGGSWDYFTANYASWHLVHEGNPWLDGATVPGLEGDPEESTWMHGRPRTATRSSGGSPGSSRSRCRRTGSPRRTP